MQTLQARPAALEDVSEGLVNTPAQQRFMLAQHELLGKYAGFSPTLRGGHPGAAPFLPWALNAARFVYWTMPRTSALTALLTASTRRWPEGLDADPRGHAARDLRSRSRTARAAGSTSRATRRTG
jgi:hypothetical protein